MTVSDRESRNKTVSSNSFSFPLATKTSLRSPTARFFFSVVTTTMFLLSFSGTESSLM